MRYLVLTDIHGNIDALDAVLERGRRRSRRTCCWVTSSATAPARTK